VSGDTGSRRLAAILAADVVGYSRLIGADEAGTLVRLRTLRSEVVDPLVAESGGRVFKTTGDGLLAEFSSVVQALRCAIGVQERLRGGEMQLRIGVHQGDVVVEADDLLGDGVNVAARLEALAEPGGICISGRVREDAVGKLALEVEDLGEPELKNIAQRHRVFRVRVGAPRRPALVLPDKPSIAVLPFQNMSGDPEQEYFADGVADDIITELAHVRSLFVIARNSSFAYKGRAVDVRQIASELGVRYILEGSVRRTADRLRITAQLVNAEIGSHLWANRYDRPLQDLFTLQDEIALAVAKAISPVVSEAEQRRALRRPPENLDAWEAYHRGLWHATKFSADQIEPARKFLDRALVLDPTLASAHAVLAWLYVIESGAYGLRPFQEAALLEAEQARMAVNLDPNDAYAHGILAFALFNGHENEAASDHVDLALSISPSCALAHQTRGLILNFSGQPAEGRESFLLAMQHDPREKRQISTLVGMTYYFERDYERAAESLRRTLADFPTNPPALRWLAAALGQIGRTDEARIALSEALAKAPDSFARYTRERPPWFAPEDYEHMLDGLRKAGWQG
jgi:adenylate cyclase